MKKNEDKRIREREDKNIKYKRKLGGGIAFSLYKCKREAL